MTDSKVYVAIRRGVYRHELVGVFTEVDRAIAAGHESVQAERDHYHDVEVLACTLDGGAEDLIGEVTAVWEGVPRKYRGTRWTGPTTRPRT